MPQKKKSVLAGFGGAQPLKSKCVGVGFCVIETRVFSTSQLVSACKRKEKLKCS
jgi:hypothetical protein